MEDEQIIQQVLRGEERAFEALVLRYQRPLFHYLGRMGMGQADAEDLAQEAFVRAYRHLPCFEPRRARFSTWLFTITRRLALNELSRAGRSARGGIEDPASMPVATDQAEVVDETKLKQRLHDALGQLPLKHRSALSLAYLRGLGIEEIARIEGCSSGTVKSRIHRGKRRLRALLADILGDDDHA